MRVEFVWVWCLVFGVWGLESCRTFMFDLICVFVCSDLVCFGLVCLDLVFGVWRRRLVAPAFAVVLIWLDQTPSCLIW